MTKWQTGTPGRMDWPTKLRYWKSSWSK